jgi:hypothetical protein
LNALNRCGDIIFLSLEVDDTILSSVTAADMSCSDSTEVVTTAAVALVVHKGSFGLCANRQIIVGQYRYETTTSRRGFIRFNSHFLFSPPLSQRIEEFDGLAIRFKRYDCFFTVRRVTFVSAHSLQFALTGNGVYACNFNAEKFFNSQLDFRLVRVVLYDERVLFISDTVITFFGEDGFQNDIFCKH